jgi:hypothetical protein
MSLAVPLTDPKFCAMAAGKLRVTIAPAKASIVKILFIVASRHKLKMRFSPFDVDPKAGNRKLKIVIARLPL